MGGADPQAGAAAGRLAEMLSTEEGEPARSTMPDCNSCTCECQIMHVAASSDTCAAMGQ